MSNSPTAANPLHEVIREGSALLGFMDETDGLRFLKGMCVWDPPKDENELRALWLDRRKKADALPRGYQLPSLFDLPADSANHVAKVTESPMFRNVFREANYEFKAVEIDKIIAFQKFVDVDFTKRLRFEDPRSLNPAVLETCIPTQFPIEAMAHVNQEERSITFISRQMNPTIAGFGIGQDPGGGLVAQFALGSNANYVQAVEYRNRITLRNGYHRCYSLRAAGATHVPCILIHTEEFMQTGAGKEGFFGERLMYSDRPPLIKHFFDPSVSAQVKLVGVKRVIRIRVDETVLPV